MFFIKKFKEWWDIIDFRNNVISLIKETPDVKKNITIFFWVILVFSFISSLWKSFSNEFMIGNLIFNTIRDTIYYSLEIFLIGLLIYFVLRYIFKKNVLSKNFLSPYFKINTAVFGVVTWLFALLTIAIILLSIVVLLIVLLTKNPSILISLYILAISSISLMIVLIFLVFVWAIISIILQVKLIKNVFMMNGFLSFLILIVAGIIIGLIVSPISKIEAPEVMNEISIGYNRLLPGEFGERYESENLALNYEKEITRKQLEAQKS